MDLEDGVTLDMEALLELADSLRRDLSSLEWIKFQHNNSGLNYREVIIRIVRCVDSTVRLVPYEQLALDPLEPDCEELEQQVLIKM